MMNKEQFDQLLKFSRELLTVEPEAKALLAKADFSPEQLEVIAILVSYTIRAYDALQDGGEFVFS